MPRASKLEVDHNHRLFALHYLETGDRVEAYKRVYPDCTESSAETISRRLLNRPEIRKMVNKVRDALFTEGMASAQQVLIETSHIAMARITDVCSFDESGVRIHPSDELEPEYAAAVKRIRNDERYSIDSGVTTKSQEVLMHDKVSALSRMLVFHGLDKGFDTHRRGLKNYGLALVEDETCESGWRVDKHVIPNSEHES